MWILKGILLGLAVFFFGSIAYGNVCYEYSFLGEMTVEYGVLTTDGLLYLNDTTPWRQLCEGKTADNLLDAQTNFEHEHGLTRSPD